MHYETFLDLLQSGIPFEADLNIGGCDMPATFCWDEHCRITDYGITQFRPILEAAYTRLSNGNIEIHCDDDQLGEHFTLAAAGFIGEQEYARLFQQP